MKSDVEVYWDRIALACEDKRKWYDLSQREQIMVVQSIQLMLSVLSRG